MQTKRNCNSWSIIDFCSSSCRRINASEWHHPFSFAQSNVEKLSEWCTNPLHFNLVDEADWKCSDAPMRNRRNHKKFEFSRAVRRIFCRTSNFARKGCSSLPALFLSTNPRLFDGDQTGLDEDDGGYPGLPDATKKTALTLQPPETSSQTARNKVNPA